jgi:hypothetical protein
MNKRIQGHHYVGFLHPYDETCVQQALNELADSFAFTEPAKSEYFRWGGRPSGSS